VTLAIRAKLVLPVLKGNPVHRAKKATRETRAKLVLPVLKGNPVHRAFPAFRACPVRLAHKVRRVTLARLVRVALRV
jgi:hypothetical protein